MSLLRGQKLRNFQLQLTPKRRSPVRTTTSIIAPRAANRYQYVVGKPEMSFTNLKSILKSLKPVMFLKRKTCTQAQRRADIHLFCLSSIFSVVSLILIISLSSSKELHSKLKNTRHTAICLPPKPTMPKPAPHPIKPSRARCHTIHRSI